ncbi:hypothetical protein YC2023_017725 [Brassica napus]
MEFRRLQLFSLKPKLIIATLTRITGRTTTCTASVRRCCKGYLRIRTCDSQCKPAQQVVLPYCVRVKELLPLCPTKRLIFSNLHHIFI